VATDVAWLNVRIDKETSKSRVISARDFVKGEYISLFMGKVLNSSQKKSQYALQSKFGTVDPKRGILDSGSATLEFAMHLVVKTDKVNAVNAKILDSFLVVATKEIKAGDEIFFSCKSKDVWHSKENDGKSETYLL
jgi:hypothetical protein